MKGRRKGGKERGGKEGRRRGRNLSFEIVS